MITPDFKNNKVLLLGGTSTNLLRYSDKMFELHHNQSRWREIDYPVNSLTHGQLTFKLNEDQMKIFCGNSFFYIHILLIDLLKYHFQCCLQMKQLH